MSRSTFQRVHATGFETGAPLRGAAALLVLLCGGLLLASAAAAQATGDVAGRVVDSETGAPIAGVQIYLEGTDLGTLSQSNGQFVLLQVPAGTHQLVAERIGRETVRREISVGADESVEVNLEMASEALGLDELVVTGTPGGTQRRAIGNVVGEIDAGVVEAAPIDDLSDMLRGREAGVVVNVGQGAPGTASVVRIRGQASMSASNQPLVYVDGVRVNNRMSTPQGGSTPAAISRIDDFAPSEIERVEVIKGPAASTLYGTEAAHGVIHIITKKGSFNEPTRWNFSTRQGANWFQDPAGHVPVNWGLHPESGEPMALNLYEREKERGNDFFSYGRVQEYSASVQGGTEDIRYFVSASALDEEGVTPESWNERYNARANVSAAAGASVTIDANAGLTLMSARVPGRGSSDGALRSLYLAQPDGLGTPRRGYMTAPPEAFYEKAQFYQDANRMTGGVTVNHDPAGWFDHRLTFGVDLTGQKNTDFTPHLSPFAAQFWPAQTAAGQKEVDQETVLQTSFDYGASANYDVSDDVAFTTSSGLQVNTKRIELVEAEGEGFPAVGVESIGGAATTFGFDDVIENNTVGLYLQQQLGWRDRMFLTAAIRADDNSAFGEEFSLVYYPKISGSWVLSEESFWGVDFVNSLRLRAAYGESGQQPDVFDAVRSFSPRSQPDGSAGVYPDAPGNPDLGPERGREVEVGFDAQMLEDRLSLDFTFYNQITEDAIVARNVAPSTGFLDQQFVNIGKLSNRGVEVGLDARMIESQGFDWDLGLNLGTNRNRIEELGLEGFLELGWTTRHTEGYPAASYFAPRVVSADLDENGEPVNIRCDDGQGGTIDCFEAPYLFAGHPDPNAEGSVTSTFRFADRVELSLLTDFKLGQSNYSTQMWWRYAALGVGEELWEDDPDPRIVAASYLGRFGEFQFWVPKAGFARLREVSLGSTLPEAWVQRFGAQRGRISLAARNLGMLWTEYYPHPYQDPEVRAPANVLGGNREPENTASVPPLTSLTMTLRLTF